MQVFFYSKNNAIWRRRSHPTPFEIKRYFSIFGFLPTFLPTIYRANDGEQAPSILAKTCTRIAIRSALTISVNESEKGAQTPRTPRTERGVRDEPELEPLDLQ